MLLLTVSCIVGSLYAYSVCSIVQHAYNKHVCVCVWEGGGGGGGALSVIRICNCMCKGICDLRILKVYRT